ncbi:Transglutaminase-like superfamily protein [Anatilimnocola aggregata]|uniref:Transglutaminase-like superfamily protein n=1 Tax=Anatilimnocola aggregata TaxID=2528021 RepID=A0A517YKS0_9BACT|nr:transglutaminase-like domain-containing protein [Anatilimnocola aggregata]QDU30814.1 Transglutaminase-like superfamily protein [Anatilimnocola aggregata]
MIKSHYRGRLYLLLLGIGILLVANAYGAEPRIRFGKEVTKQYRFGFKVEAPAGAVTGIVATMAVPMDWPEQTVKVISEDVTPKCRVTYRVIDNGVKQMVVNIPRLAKGEEAGVEVVYEITKREILAPDLTADFVIPTKLNKDLQKLLQPSPFIESNDAQIKQLAPTIIEGQATAWDQTGAILDWVRANVQYKFAVDIKPAIAALKDKEGDCEELSSLFIAFCRANKIPARAVWVPGHTYPEYYLEDAAGNGHWFPCQAAGAAREFGTIFEDRPILQKGDNFKVPEEKLPQRYVKQFLKAANAQADPIVKFIGERVKK